MLTTDELRVIERLLDAGVRATGLQIFQGGGGIHVQSALAKLQQMAEEAGREASPQTAREGVPVSEI